MDAFVKAPNPSATNLIGDLPLAKAVLADPDRAGQLEREWRGTFAGKATSLAYRDLLWTLAWEQYQESLSHRGKLNAPNLFMNRGRLLLSQGKFQQAVGEFQNAVTLAKASSYELIRQETVTHALRAVGTAYWHMRNFREAQPWFLQAQEVQRKSGHAWIATLDQEVQEVRMLAASQRQP